MTAPRLVVGLAGNPNAGKTTIFNALTGAHQKVGNWGGVTVEKKEGVVNFGADTIEVVDLPGIYSLSAYSMEELVARNFIIHDHPDVIVIVLDASNLERNLFLAAQILEMGVPVVLALNMVDVAESRHIRINQLKLAELLGAPVTPTIGREKKGLEPLIETVRRVAAGADQLVRHIHIPYGKDIEVELSRIEEQLHADHQLAPLISECPRIGTKPSRQAGTYPCRWIALKLLINDQDIIGRIKEIEPEAPLLGAAAESRARLEKIFDDEIESLVTERIYAFLKGISREVIDQARGKQVYMSDRVDRFLTHQFLGLPIFLVIIWAIFEGTFAFGHLPSSLIESFFHALRQAVGTLLGPGLLRDLLADGIIDGVGGVLVFLPNILLLFFFISILEDSGYMARAAFLVDRVMHIIGLHGKSFISLITSFGCNAPGIMATRTLESEDDRLITILINPLMSCSARLPVYILLSGAFFPEHAGTVIFSIYLIGILLAVLMGKLFRKFLFPGGCAPFVMELPPYRVPTPQSVMLHMWEKGVVFVRKAGSIILFGVVLVWALNYFPRQVTFSQDYDAKISKIEQTEAGRLAEFDRDYHQEVKRLRQEYRSTFLPLEQTGLFRELKDYYERRRQEIAGEYEAKIGELSLERKAELMQKRLAGRTGALLEPVLAPLGFDWRCGVALIPGLVAKEIVVASMAVLFRAGDENAEAEAQSLQVALRRSGVFTPLSAFAFMVFTLLYTPCLATVGVIYKETGSLKWTLFTIGYSLVLAWCVTFIIYQGGRLLGLE